VIDEFDALPRTFLQSVIECNGLGWKALPCQRSSCEAEHKHPIMVACMDHVTALGASPDTAPPLYMCLKCKEQLEKNQSNVELQEVLKPMTNIATSCENKVIILRRVRTR
jgi:hypothetical protein